MYARVLYMLTGEGEMKILTDAFQKFGSKFLHVNRRSNASFNVSTYSRRPLSCSTHYDDHFGG